MPWATKQRKGTLNYKQNQTCTMEIEQFDGIIIVGAGLVGSMAALTLKRRGFDVRVYEKNSDWRDVDGWVAPYEQKKPGERALKQEKSAVKRSINLALSTRGQAALQNVGLFDQAMSLAVPMYGRAIHSNCSSNPHPDKFQPYDEIDRSNYINSISREHLNALLLEELEGEGVKVMFGSPLVRIDKAGFAVFQLDEGETWVDPKLLLGCDGAYSMTRSSLERVMSQDLNRFYVSHGYKELHMPPSSATGDFALENPNALHIWPRDEFMMIGLPNADKSFTCTIFAPFHTQDGVPGLLDLDEASEIQAYFDAYFPDVTQVIPDYIKQFQRNPACRLVTISTGPWNWGDKVLLIGDAAHACVPFYGQGMNCGFEDVLELDETIQTFAGDLSQAVPAFAERRKPKGDAIAQLSLQNYMEMRSHTASTLFLLQKKFEGLLNMVLPTLWVPLYKMVTFTRIPYNVVIERAALQEKLLKVASCGLLAIAALATVRSVARGFLFN